MNELVKQARSGDIKAQAFDLTFGNGGLKAPDFAADSAVSPALQAEFKKKIEDSGPEDRLAPEQGASGTALMVVGCGSPSRSAPDVFAGKRDARKGPRLSLRDITKKFGDFTAIDKVAIELFRGEIHAIVGENGAGKSTLTRVLAGHMAATGGSMILEEAPIAIDRAAPGQRPTIGFLEQEGGLITELSGAENLYSAVASGIWPISGRSDNRLKTLAKQFGGAIDPDVPVLSLTMGQRQRL